MCVCCGVSAKNSQAPVECLLVFGGVEPLAFQNLFPVWQVDEKARSKQPTSGAGRSGGNKGFEVENPEEAAVGPPPASLEQGLILVTFVALVVGLILAQMDLSSTYGKGLL